MSKPRVGPPELVSQLNLCTSNHYGQPIVLTELAIKTFYQNSYER